LAITTEVSAMNLKTLRLSFWLGLAVGAFSTSVGARPIRGGGLKVKVSVFNDAQITKGKVATAEKVAAGLFAPTGIRIDWLNCGLATETSDETDSCNEAAFPTHLAIRLRQKSLNLSESTLGLSYLGQDGIGCYADVFYAGVDPIQRDTGLSSEAILGFVIAHELGHLLLGTNSHATAGIMRANWRKPELSAAGKGLLGFSEAQAKTMRARLENFSSRAGAGSRSR
jgi:hypothetical protein